MSGESRALAPVQLGSALLSWAASVINLLCDYCQSETPLPRRSALMGTICHRAQPAMEGAGWGVREEWWRWRGEGRTRRQERVRLFDGGRGVEEGVTGSGGGKRGAGRRGRRRGRRAGGQRLIKGKGGMRRGGKKSQAERGKSDVYTYLHRQRQGKTHGERYKEGEVEE